MLTIVKILEHLDSLVAVAPQLDPALEAEIELTLSAHACVGIEQIMRLRKLAPYIAQDPAMVRRIESLIRSCR